MLSICLINKNEQIIMIEIEYESRTICQKKSGLQLFVNINTKSLCITKMICTHQIVNNNKFEKNITKWT